MSDKRMHPGRSVAQVPQQLNSILGPKNFAQMGDARSRDVGLADVPQRGEDRRAHSMKPNKLTRRAVVKLNRDRTCLDGVATSGRQIDEPRWHLFGQAQSVGGVSFVLMAEPLGDARTRYTGSKRLDAFRGNIVSIPDETSSVQSADSRYHRGQRLFSRTRFPAVRPLGCRFSAGMG